MAKRIKRATKAKPRKAAKPPIPGLTKRQIAAINKNWAHSQEGD